MGVVPGWADRDVFVLLELFRAHLWDYIYRSSEDFAEIVHAALPGAYCSCGSKERRGKYRSTVEEAAPFATVLLFLACVVRTT